MQAAWEIDVVDLKKQMIKVHMLGSSLTKNFFIPGLLDAKLQFPTLIATCQDGIWKVDITTGVRHRVSDKVFGGTSQLHIMASNAAIPEFLKKITA